MLSFKNFSKEKIKTNKKVTTVKKYIRPENTKSVKVKSQKKYAKQISTIAY